MCGRFVGSNRVIRMARTLVAANLQVSMAYKLNFFLGILSVMVLFLVHYNLWKVIFDGHDSDKIGEYTFGEMIVYVAISRALFLLVNSLSVERTVADEIKSGKLSTILVKPVNYLTYRLLCKTGDVIVHFVTATLAFAILFLVAIGDYSLLPGGSGVAAVLCTALGGMLINTLIGFAFALTAFWMDHVDVMFVSKRLVISFVSGVWIPISFFPEALRNALDFLPFNWLQYFSVRIFLGKVSGQEILNGLAVQAFWIVALFLLSGLMWRRGMKRYTSTGG